MAQNFSNLVSESVLVTETVELLKISGGQITVTEIMSSVFNMSKVHDELAISLVSDLVKTDPRLNLIREAQTVELILPNFDARKLSETDFVVFDLETTGAKVPPCRVTEIGAYRIENSKIVDEFQTLVNPETPIPFFITQLTGISDEMVYDAPKFCDIADSFLEFIGDAVLVAHNAPFDMKFLNHEIGKVYDGYRMHNPHLCTVQLSRKLLPTLDNHKLHTVADFFSLNIENRHRAADDALATAKIFVNFLENFQEKGLADFASLKKFKKANN